MVCAVFCHLFHIAVWVVVTWPVCLCSLSALSYCIRRFLGLLPDFFRLQGSRRRLNICFLSYSSDSLWDRRVLSPSFSLLFLITGYQWKEVHFLMMAVIMCHSHWLNNQLGSWPRSIILIMVFVSIFFPPLFLSRITSCLYPRKIQDFHFFLYIQKV